MEQLFLGPRTRIGVILTAMKRTDRNFLDLHPKLFINGRIFWIIFGTGLLDKWLPRTAASWTAGETYNLPMGIAYSVIGLVVVVSGFIMVNSAVSRLQSKIVADPDPGEAELR
jgi:TRAP-type mannitol/chloroaromatic compound transport system permease small subunit